MYLLSPPPPHAHSRNVVALRSQNTDEKTKSSDKQSVPDRSVNISPLVTVHLYARGQNSNVISIEPVAVRRPYRTWNSNRLLVQNRSDVRWPSNSSHSCSNSPDVMAPEARAQRTNAERTYVTYAGACGLRHAPMLPHSYNCRARPWQQERERDNTPSRAAVVAGRRRPKVVRVKLKHDGGKLS